MEAIELYCDLLLARIGLIESQKYVNIHYEPYLFYSSLSLDLYFNLLPSFSLFLYLNLDLPSFSNSLNSRWCDEGLSTPVCTLIWVAPRMMAEVSELKAVCITCYPIFFPISPCSIITCLCLLVPYYLPHIYLSHIYVSHV